MISRACSAWRDFWCSFTGLCSDPWRDEMEAQKAAAQRAADKLGTGHLWSDRLERRDY